MSFQTLTEIRETFGISSDDPEQLRRELKKRLKDIHPDTNPAGGRTEEMLKVTAALQFLDESRRTTAVVPVEEVTSLVQALKVLLPESLREKELQEQLTERIEEKVRDTREAGRLPRLLLTGLAGALSIIWLFPGIVSRNPVLRRIVDVQNPVFNVIWIALFIYTVAVWFVFSRWTRREAAAKKKLKLASTQQRLLTAFIHDLAELQARSGDITFFKDQFISYLEESGLRGSGLTAFFLGASRGIDDELAEELAETILFTSVKRGVLRREAARSLREQYRLTVPISAL